MLQTGLTMSPPLLIADIIEHAAAQFGAAQIVSRETDGSLWRYTYADCARESRRLANALAAFGLVGGDAVASIAWNNRRHLEAYFAVSGSGMVMHTCNPRLHPEQLVYILNHAEDKVVLFDTTFAPLIAAIAPRCPGVRAWICLCPPAQLPAVPGADALLDYDSFVAPHGDGFDWPRFDERTAAALCYTSGTTGNPKGVLYSHRSMVLNAMSGCMANSLALSAREAVLPVVPMFHINAWCIPYAAPIAGSKLVLPGPKLDGASLYQLMEDEGVTVSAGVPTIWQGLLAHVEQHGLRFSTMRRTAVGGSAMPKALIAKFMEQYGVDVRHGWGMTETTAAATMGCLSAEQMAMPPDARHEVLARQGKTYFGVQTRIVDAGGRVLPRDGESQGELQVRGQWIAEGYYKMPGSPLVDGWFPTGDIATIDADGVLYIRDRIKDVIKSGGEWISSIDLENAATAHPAVGMAAVIGVKHPQWDERPLMLVVRKPGQTLDKPELLAFLEGRVAKWWVPDDVIFVDSLPVGGTGKVQKSELRRQYGGTFS